MICFSSCGCDSCTQIDWIGIYTYQVSVDTCDLEDGFSLEYQPTIAVVAGSEDNVSYKNTLYFDVQIQFTS